MDLEMQHASNFLCGLATQGLKLNFPYIIALPARLQNSACPPPLCVLLHEYIDLILSKTVLLP